MHIGKLFKLPKIECELDYIKNKKVKYFKGSPW